MSTLHLQHHYHTTTCPASCVECSYPLPEQLSADNAEEVSQSCWEELQSKSLLQGMKQRQTNMHTQWDAHKITYILYALVYQHCTYATMHSTVRVVACPTTIRRRAVATERTIVKLVHTPHEACTYVLDATQRAHFPSLSQLVSHCPLCMCAPTTKPAWLQTATGCATTTGLVRITRHHAPAQAIAVQSCTHCYHLPSVEPRRHLLGS